MQKNKAQKSMTDPWIKNSAERDLINFAKIRTAYQSDDLALGDMLVRTFRQTQQESLSYLLTSTKREIELRDIQSRRRNGRVRILELGFQIIGTYSLSAQKSAQDESWTDNICTLHCVAIERKFQSQAILEKLLIDAIHQAQKWRAEGICLHIQEDADAVARVFGQFGFKHDTRGDKLWMGATIKGYLLPLKPYTENDLEHCEILNQMTTQEE